MYLAEDKRAIVGSANASYISIHFKPSGTSIVENCSYIPSQKLEIQYKKGKKITICYDSGNLINGMKLRQVDKNILIGKVEDLWKKTKNGLISLYDARGIIFPE